MEKYPDTVILYSPVPCSDCYNLSYTYRYLHLTEFESLQQSDYSTLHQINPLDFPIQSCDLTSSLQFSHVT